MVRPLYNMTWLTLLQQSAHGRQAPGTRLSTSSRSVDVLHGLHLLLREFALALLAALALLHRCAIRGEFRYDITGPVRVFFTRAAATMYSEDKSTQKSAREQADVHCVCCRSAGPKPAPTCSRCIGSLKTMEHAWRRTSQ